VIEDDIEGKAICIHEIKNRTQMLRVRKIYSAGGAVTFMLFSPAIFADPIRKKIYCNASSTRMKEREECADGQPSSSVCSMATGLLLTHPAISSVRTSASPTRIKARRITYPSRRPTEGTMATTTTIDYLSSPQL
jgi:hypothetical protein